MPIPNVKVLARIFLYLIFCIFLTVGAMFIVRGGMFLYLRMSYFILFGFVLITSFLYFKLNVIGKLRRQKYAELFSLFFPFTLLATYGLIVDPDLFPSIFPSITIISLIATTSSFLFCLSQKRGAFSLLCFGVFSIFVWNTWFLIPLQRSKNTKKEFIVPQRISVTGYDVINESGDTIPISKLTNGKIALFDFMFNNCLPCRRKLPFLNKLSKEVGDKTMILIIVNGKADRFDSYQKMVTEYKYLNYIKFYYDANGRFTQSLRVDEFPTEFIVDKNKIIKQITKSFDPILEENYLYDTKKILSNLE